MTPYPDDDPPRSRAGRKRFLALVVGVAALVVAALLVGPDRETLLRIGTAGGPFAPVFAVVGSAVLATVVLPRTLLAFVAGALYGWWPGALYALVGVTLGAFVAFTVGRLLGRTFVSHRLRGRLALVERMVAHRGAFAVAISRMIPVVPFGVSNYLFGTTAVRPGRFALGTLLGTAPTTAAYAALGSATMQGNPVGAMFAGAAVTTLGVGGAIGTYLVWRHRPWSRKRAPGADAGEPALALTPGRAAAPQQPGRTAG